MYQKKNIRMKFDGDLDFKMFKGLDWGVGSARVCSLLVTISFLLY